MSVARAFARAEDGTETDITEGVQALYDLVISSMDFRSGFWTVEDAVPVAVIARLLKFKQAEEIERYLRHQQHNREQQEFLARRQDAKAHRPLPEHDHVFSSAGKCMWFYCEALDADAVDWIGGRA